MTQEEAHSPQSQKLPRPPGDWRRTGLKRKIISYLVGGVILFGLLVIAVAYQQVGHLLRTQLARRGLDIATNLGDAAASHILKGNVLELYALVTKYSLSAGVAYSLVRDEKGKIVAHSLGVSPELGESLTVGNQRQETQRELIFRGRKVYESQVPIHEGQRGNVYIGIWADTVEEEVHHALFPLISIIVITLVANVVFSILVALRIIRPVLRLKEVANKVSMGDLETPLGIESNDEIGDLAYSLDRLRASLKAAMMRLRRA